MTIRTYSELSRIKTYAERFEYLKLGGMIGESTFGFDRCLNQALYRSREWRSIRDAVILRDGGFDLGIEGHPIGNRIIIHHMNPITKKAIEERINVLFNPDYLVCVAPVTHNAIHFGDASLLPKPPIERQPWDTCPWR